MPAFLTIVETRVLGCLIEKEKTTPEYYPLTLNALTNACNQKSSRDPVMELNQNEVIRAVFSLKDRGIIVEKNDGGRVAKYAHNFPKLMMASEAERAVLCLLMLRGPQTAGEIRNRCERLAEFSNPVEVEAILQELATKKEGPYTVLLPRQTGQKERRYMHLFSGDPLTAIEPEVEKKETLKLDTPSLEERITNLERRIETLEKQLKGD